MLCFLESLKVIMVMVNMLTLHVIPMYQGSFTSSWAEPLLLPVLTDRTWAHIVDIVDIIDISLSYRYVHRPSPGPPPPPPP